MSDVMQPTLKLSNREPFAIGGTRRCYLHPEDDSLCVKVLRSDRTPQRRRDRATGLKRFRSLDHWDDQLKEKLAYERLIKRHGPKVWNHVPQFFGVVDTDEGMGIVTKLFRNSDGSFPLNLDDQVPLGIDAPLNAAIEQFKSWLRHELVLTRGLLPHNIIAVRDSATECRLVIVDGLGNSEWIPISDWFRPVARAKVERKIARFERRLELLQDKT